MKFKIYEQVWYMHTNKACTDRILARQERAHCRGKIHFAEDYLFTTKQELIDSL